MKKFIYNFTTLSHQDLQLGPSAFARFGTVEEPDAEDNGIDFFVQKQTARYMTYDLTPEEADARARDDAFRVRMKRHALNEQFKQSELNRMDGEVEYVLEFDPLDGKYHLYNEDSEEFLHDMVDNWRKHLEKEGRSREFDQAEADAILAIDGKLANGEAKSVAYMVSDVSGTVRYANQFVVGEDGRISAQYIDIGKFVRDLSPEEAYDVTCSLGEKFGLTVEKNALGYSYLVSRDRSLNAKDIHEAVFQKLIDADGQESVEKNFRNWQKRGREHEVAQYEQNQLAKTIHDVEVTLGDVGQKAMHDIQATLAPIGTLLAAEYFHRRKKEEEGKHKVAQTPSETEPKKKQSLVEKITKLIHKPESSATASVKSKPEAETGQRSRGVVFELTKAKQKSEQGSEQKKPETAKRTILLVLRLLPVAGDFGLSGLVLRSLAASEKISGKKRLKKGRQLNALKYSAAERRQKIIESKRRKQRRSVIPMGEKFPLGVHNKESVLFLKKRKRKHREVSLFITGAAEGKQKRNFEKRAFVRKTEKQIMLVLHRILRKSDRERQKARTAKHSAEGLHPIIGEVKFPQVNFEVHQKLREPVRSLSVSILLWLLIRLHDQEKRGIGVIFQAIYSYPARQNSLHTPAVDGGKDHEKMEQREGSPWLLLAIIWYLAMIREQGFSKYTNPTKRKKRRKRRKAPPRSTYLMRLPQYGIIYAAFP